MFEINLYTPRCRAARLLVTGLTLAGMIFLACSLPQPAPTFTPAPQWLATPDLPVDQPALQYIPAGSFQMGERAARGLAECQALLEPFSTALCEPDWFRGEEPPHAVTLDAFFIHQTEVTNGMYASCVSAGACSPPPYSGSHTRSSYFGDAAFENYPVIYIDWSAAAKYCAWAGGRLPTEAEWEFAARGGQAGQLYPWGDTFDGSLANFCDAACGFDWLNQNYTDGFPDTAPVGSFPANGYGLVDMAGNVWEWVADWYSAYPQEPVDNPTGPDSAAARILRGGSLDSYGSDLRVAARYQRYNGSMIESYDVGFRCIFIPTH